MSRARTTPVLLSGLWSDVLAWCALSPIQPSDDLSRPGQRVLIDVRKRASEGARYASGTGLSLQLVGRVLPGQGLRVVVLFPMGNFGFVHTDMVCPISL